MISLKEEISTLISLTKQHLSQEYSPEQWLVTDPKTFESYKNFSLKNKERKTPQPLPKMTTSSPPKASLAAIQAPKPKTPIETPTKPEKHTPEKSQVLLEHPASTPPTDTFDDLQKMMNKLFPQQKLSCEPLDEEQFKSKKAPEALILFNDEIGKELGFLNNLTKAIELSLCHADMVSLANKKWEAHVNSASVKWIIGSEQTLKIFSEKYPSISAILLPDIKTLFENPGNKALLWEKIRNHA